MQQNIYAAHHKLHQPEHTINEEKEATASGYFPLFHYNPATGEFSTDSQADFSKYKDFLVGENRYLSLTKITKDSEKLLLVKYGISKQNATKYLDRYGKDVNRLPNSKEKEFLLDINNIINHNKTNNMKLESYDFINYIGTKLRNLYVDIYNKEFPNNIFIFRENN